LEKNWLISPPGSPQEGWIQIEEDPPNKVALHEDIQSALDRLAQELEEEEEEIENTNGVKGNVILDTTSLGGVQVIVHDWDEMDSPTDDDFGGMGIRNTRTSAEVVGRTPRPPANP
jgi:calcipressin-2